SKKRNIARNLRPAVGSTLMAFRIFSYIDSASIASDVRSSSSLFLKWVYIAPLVSPVAPVMSLRDVDLYPWVLNNTPARCNILFRVYSGSRMHKDTDRYVQIQTKKRDQKRRGKGQFSRTKRSTSRP